jgi:hypothetical protein
MGAGVLTLAADDLLDPHKPGARERLRDVYGAPPASEGFVVEPIPLDQAEEEDHFIRRLSAC